MLKNQEKNEQTISKLQAKISSGQSDFFFFFLFLISTEFINFFFF